VWQYKISQNSAHWETVCFTQTGRHYEAKSSFSRYSANAHKIFDAYFFRCSCRDKYFLFSNLWLVIEMPNIAFFFQYFETAVTKYTPVL